MSAVKGRRVPPCEEGRLTGTALRKSVHAQEGIQGEYGRFQAAAGSSLSRSGPVAAVQGWNLVVEERSECRDVG